LPAQPRSVSSELRNHVAEIDVNELLKGSPRGA
jgi:hypothetical protein